MPYPYKPIEEETDPRMIQARRGFQVVPNLPQPFPEEQAPLTLTAMPAARPIPAIAPAITPTVAPAPAPAPAQPAITALTTNAQMEAASRNAVGLGRLTDANKAMAARLAIQTREGGPRAIEAQKQLTNLGVTATTGYLLGETNQMTRAKEMRAAVSPMTLPPAQRKLAEADYNRAYAIYNQQREQAYADDVRKMTYDTAQAKLGNERLKTIEVQGKIALNTENVLDKQLERQDKLAKAPYELAKARTQAELDAIQLQNTRDMQAPINPDTAKADELMAAPTIDKYKQTWDQGLSLAARYNIPEPVRNELHLGVLASSYDSPVELAKDSGAKIDEEITSVSQSNVAKYAPDIAAAIANNTPPDQAVEQILRDSGKDPSDKGYPQLALNISAGVWKQYKDAGEAAMAEAKAAKVYSDALNRQKAVTQIAQQIPLMSIAGGWNDIVASTQKRLDRLALVRGMKTGIVGEQQGVLAEAGIRREFGLGASEQYTKTTSEQIKSMIINHMADLAGNDPSYKAWLADQAINPDSEVSRLLTMGVNEARKGQKSEMEEQEKQQAERKVIEKEALATGLFPAYPDPLTSEHELFDSSTKRDMWLQSDSATRKAILKADEINARKRLIGLTGNADFKALPAQRQDYILSIKYLVEDGNEMELMRKHRLGLEDAVGKLEDWDKTYFTLSAEDEQASAAEWSLLPSEQPPARTPAQDAAIADIKAKILDPNISEPKRQYFRDLLNTYTAGKNQ